MFFGNFLCNLEGLWLQGFWKKRITLIELLVGIFERVAFKKTCEQN